MKVKFLIIVNKMSMIKLVTATLLSVFIRSED